MELDLGDVLLDECFALSWGAVADDVGQVAAELVDGALAGLAGCGGEGVFEVGAAAVEPVEADLQFLDALAAGFGVEGAGLEGVEVAVAGGFGLCDLVAYGGEFGAVGFVPMGAQAPLGVGGFADDLGAGVEVEECVEDGLVGLLGG